MAISLGLMGFQASLSKPVKLKWLIYYYFFETVLLRPLAGLPNIPIQPIGYGDAKIILQSMVGTRAPEDWQGGIRHTLNDSIISYNLNTLGNGLEIGINVQVK